MAIRLNTPEPLELIRDGALVGYTLSVPHKLDENGELVIDRAAVRFAGVIGMYNGAGQEVRSHGINVPLDQMPQQAREALKGLYAWLEAQAIARGTVGDGNAEPL
jgi:hypothetical protein